jgi:hypothetical protein
MGNQAIFGASEYRQGIRDRKVLWVKESRHGDKARNIREGQTHTYERGCSSNNIRDVRNVYGAVLCTSGKRSDDLSTN